MSKNNSIIIDFTVLNKLNLKVKDYLFLVYLYTNNSNFIIDGDYKFLEENNYIKIDEIGEVHLRQEAIELINYLSIPSFGEFKSPKIIKKTKKQINIEINSNIDQYREKWRGLKLGSMGGRKACIDKLTRWMTENPEYTFEQILKAADLYLDNEGRDTRFLQRADYFIFKQDTHKGEMSRLSAYIDELETNSITGDWTSTLK